ncbi:MAG: hypothetical protein WBP38_09935 [Hyphomicrobium sp.]|nr:hypothetical protein [Hyphomicrobium sp.]
MRHVLGVLGVLAAGVLLAVSAAMNWRFGFSLGRTELDGQIYGAASAAADCLKALIPFFFFAAIRNKIWSQAAASALVWVVVTAYSMTSALGHAALNRFDTTGQRAQVAQSYQDLRTELKKAEEESSWIPQHRPFATVQSAIEAHKSQRAWKWSNGCKDASSKSEQKYCQEFHALNAELASASGAETAEQRIAEIRSKLAGMEGTTAMSEADPQARVLTDLATAFYPGVTIENVQMALTIFVALLLEIGSGFGMYVAFSQWRLYDVKAPAAPQMVAADDNTAAAAVAAPVLTPAAVQTKKPRSGANDNKTLDKPIEAPVAEPLQIEAQIAEAQTLVAKQPEVRAIEAKPAPARRIAPETNTERFYKENVEVQDGSSVTATQLYEDYCSWCDTKNKEPSALPSFAREFAELGVKKEKVAGRVRYIGIALKSDLALEEATKTLLYRADAA